MLSEDDPTKDFIETPGNGGATRRKELGWLSHSLKDSYHWESHSLLSDYEVREKWTFVGFKSLEIGSCLQVEDWAQVTEMWELVQLMLITLTYTVIY